MNNMRAYGLYVLTLVASGVFVHCGGDPGGEVPAARDASTDGGTDAPRVDSSDVDADEGDANDAAADDSSVDAEVHDASGPDAIADAGVDSGPPPRVVGGSISGLLGTLVLQNNGGDDLTRAADGPFAFSTPVASGADYEVKVLTQPASPPQTCVVKNGSGKVAASDVTSVAVTCTTNAYKIKGTLSGLGASESIVLQDNAGDDLTLTKNGTFSFATAVEYGKNYEVTVLASPTAPIHRTCEVAKGKGTVGANDISDVSVVCSPTPYKVSVATTGLTGSGLVFQNNSGDDLTILTSGTSTFSKSIVSGNGYSVTVATQPLGPAQHCTVTSGSGTVTNANVTISVSCSYPKCEDILTSAPVWGSAARGLDLQRFTNGTLDWLGCGDDVGCANSSFFCTNETTGIFFGTSSLDALRTLVDPGNAAGAAFPTGYDTSVNDGCCGATAPRNVCNAPLANNDGVSSINAGDALCKALGYASGSVVVEQANNDCPHVYTTKLDGSNWSSFWVQDTKYGAQYRCLK